MTTNEQNATATTILRALLSTDGMAQAIQTYAHETLCDQIVQWIDETNRRDSGVEEVGGERARSAAALRVLSVLRSPIALITRPEREEALEMAKRFDLSVVDVFEVAIERARKA